MSHIISKKIRIPLEQHPDYAGESLWADQISKNIYQIKNIPIFAYGINFDDRVRVEEDEEGILQVTEVVKQSDHRTVRVLFLDNKSGEENYARLKEWKGKGIGSEQWNDTLYSLNVTPARDYEKFLDVLDIYEEQGLIAFELTGEWEGNFDGTSCDS